MKLVRARTRRSADDAAGRPAMLRWVVAGQDGELLDCIHSQVDPERASGWAVRVVVNADAVEARVVLSRTASSYGHLSSKTALGVARTLSASPRHAWLKGRDIRGRSAVQGQVTYPVGVRDPASG